MKTIETRRVVITGVGLNSPLGNSYDELFESLKNSKCGIEYIPEWENVKSLGTKIAGRVKNIDLKQIPRKYRRSMDRVAQLCAISTTNALEDANLPPEIRTSKRCGLSFGSTMGGNETMFQYIPEVKENMSFRGQNSMGFLKIMSHTVSANIAQMFSIKGRNIPTCSACTSSSQAIGAGYESIKYGLSDVMICGGGEEHHYLSAGVFDIMGAATTKHNHEPEVASRPFDESRDGLVVSEGSGAIVLESLDHALARGAKIYGEIIGYATSCDGEHITTPSQNGMKQVMETALEDANIVPSDVEYINAHATATQKGDIAESHATYSVFSDKPFVSSTKGHMGHLLGGCGVVETIICLIALNESLLPQTLNFKKLDPECAPINILGKNIEKNITIAMNNNFAFGGINTSLIFKKYKG
ncbi:beta-ketoacyl-[acyl-carrier-protein] synthase family protein [Hydrogenimonas thermophila]|uniref:beta-ketoacyl-[acyl-carrier-protein] synthase family protein n=1 Tax=Hydrogenimonas thermophila TaxID=223786 RepID=UPI0029370B3C|nr:beta-ketoacyl-[acyl-carrier-protein] synthase family protein [Hydrogenimonas thermophila]WOE69616.1 beta-ketoacyl-[acyl-carrier-protein] synthase family protein [Hydrogenimonas thermophila]WOE72130.1 beta-ketoacyl-[acyl-carrier-protein] synthase family protein [Hydrogenimonas thermophila]